MAQRIFIIWFMLIIAVFGYGTRAYSYFTDEEVTDVYQNDQFLLMEEEPGRNQFFALVKKDNYYKFIQFNGYYNEVFSIINLFDLEDLSRSVSTIDLTNRRYFFTTTSGRQSYLYVLGLDSGETLNQIKLDYKLVAMEYDDLSGYIYGLAQNRNGNTKTVRIDTNSGEVTSLSDLSRTYTMDFNTAFLKEDSQEVWITAASRKNEYILTISTVTGKANAIRVLNVEPDSQVVYNFNIMKFNQVLFSSGTKDSVFLLGFNDQYKTAFILHITAGSKNIKEKIENIQKQLLEYSPGGMTDYQVTVVCPRPLDNFVSYSKAMVLEENLKKIYGFEEIKHKEFFIGIPYKVVVSADGISVY